MSRQGEASPERERMSRRVRLCACGRPIKVKPQQRKSRGRWKALAGHDRCRQCWESGLDEVKRGAVFWEERLGYDERSGCWDEAGSEISVHGQGVG